MTIDEKIVALENSIEPGAYTFNGEAIWPVIRSNIYLSESKSGAKRASIKKMLIFFLQGLWDNIKNLFLPAKKADNVLVTTSHYKVHENGMLFDKIVDPVLKHLESRRQSYQVWEFTSDYYFSSNISYKKSMCPIQRKLYFRHRVKSLFNRSRGFNLGGDIEGLNESLTRHGLSFQVNKAFIRKLAFIFENARYFKNGLKRTAAKRVFVVCYYDAKGFAMVKAANELNLPIIDLQHGVQGESHMAYAKLPSSVIGSRFLPTHFYVWDEYSFETIKAWKGESSSILVGRNQWVLDRVRKVSNDIVLVSLQPIEGFIPEVVLREIKEYQGDKKWYLRLHPSQLDQLDNVDRVLSDWGISGKANVRDASTLPLTSLLERSILHITFYSSVAIEASYYNVPTYFLSARGATMYQNMIPNNLVYSFPKNRLPELLSLLQKDSVKNVVSNSCDLSILDRFIDASK